MPYFIEVASLPRSLYRNPRAAGLCATLSAAALGTTVWYVHQLLRRREPRRSHVLRDIAAHEVIEDAEVELTKIIEWVQDEIVRPVDALLPGRPFENELLAFPFTPMVLLIGNHSAGKSTFINKLLGISVQETGVAPTDDGFTVLERHASATKNKLIIEDGPTLLYCPENRPYRDLQRFSHSFTHHLKRKRLQLPNETKLPFGLQIVDTPGMIDMPSSVGRGYNFLEVVRWFGKRADLILLLFDPDKPGTTGEALDVLTKSLHGMDHKFLIILNKVDRLDSVVDLARAYGTLGWALSKVIPRKDLPTIYTIYNDIHGDGKQDSSHKLPLETFRHKRDEVITEVLRAKVRHWDNVITSIEDTLRQLEMVASVCSAVRDKVWMRRKQVQVCGTLALGISGFTFGRFFLRRWNEQLPHGLASFASFAVSYLVLCLGAFTFLQDSCRQFESLQVAKLDSYFEDEYKSIFIHGDGEDHRARWSSVRPRVTRILAAVPTAAVLRPISQSSIAWIKEVMSKDVLYMRQLAKIMRSAEQ